jgi:hypothetical protein
MSEIMSSRRRNTNHKRKCQLMELMEKNPFVFFSHGPSAWAKEEHTIFAFPF